MGHGAHCEICGEWIPNAVKREGGAYQYVCADCSGETRLLMGQTKRHDNLECDRRYHGGQFSRGEW